MDMTMAKMRQLRTAMVTASTSLDDQTASTAPEMFGKLCGDGELIKSGTRINWHGTVKRAAVDLYDNAESTPETAPTLWEDLPYRDGIRIIPAVITVGLTFHKDELGWWGDVLYKSLLETNTWTPEEHPGAWEKQGGV